MPAFKNQRLCFENHPQFPAAMQIIQTLKANGFEALIAGGAVRDALIGRTDVQDLDIATSAKPEEIESLFQRTIPVGKAFGVIRVLIGGQSLEVATFRLDQDYQDGRRPNFVTFATREEDAKRRDFTVNALFFDPVEGVLYDDVGGIEDIDRRVLKAVGNAAERFSEDELRRLRLIRFVSQLGFTMDPDTWQAVKSRPEGLKKVSRERVTEDLQDVEGAIF